MSYKKLHITEKDQIPEKVQKLCYAKQVMNIGSAYAQQKAYNEYGLPIINQMVANFEAKLKEVQARTELIDEGSYSFYKYSKNDRFYLSTLLKTLKENISLVNSKFPEVPNKQQPIKIQDL